VPDQSLADFDPAADFAAALVEMLPADRLGGVDRDRLRAVLADVAAPVTVAVRPLALRAQAMELQKKAGELLDEADALLYGGHLAKAADEAEQVYAAEQAEADRVADAVKEAVAAERDAVDRLAGAVEHARLATEHAEDLALAGADPAEQTDAIVRRDAARQVEARARAVAEQATARRVQAEASSATAREAARQQKLVAQRARALAVSPPVAPASRETATLDGPRRLMLGLPLDDVAREAAIDVVESLAINTGLARIWRNQGRKAVLEELNEQRNARPMKAAPDSRPVNEHYTPPGMTAAPFYAPGR
jgi:hypothetical protein